MKYLLLVGLLFMLSGCSGGSSVTACKKGKYPGMVVYQSITNPSVYCSTGDKSPSGLSYTTHSGNFPTAQYIYIKF